MQQPPLRAVAFAETDLSAAADEKHSSGSPLALLLLSTEASVSADLASVLTGRQASVAVDDRRTLAWGVALVLTSAVRLLCAGVSGWGASAFLRVDHLGAQREARQVARN